jgi:N-acyl-L-homoserine lactone synthetase
VVRRSPIEFRVAAHPSEFEQVSRLLYQTFVEEIPQHPPNPDGRHTDRFHNENQYVVAKSGDEVVGVIAIRGYRPFSLDQ